MIDTTVLKALFCDNVTLYCRELGITKQGYYKVLRTGSASIDTVCRVAAYFNIPVQNLIIVPKEYYR